MLINPAKTAFATVLLGRLRAQEPTLADLLDQLAPVELVLIEGYKRDRHPKIEAHRTEPGNPLIANGDPTIRAIATDTPLDSPVRQFDLDDTKGIADFILEEVNL